MRRGLLPPALLGPPRRALAHLVRRRGVVVLLLVAAVALAVAIRHDDVAVAVAVAVAAVVGLLLLLPRHPLLRLQRRLPLPRLELLPLGYFVLRLAGLLGVLVLPLAVLGVVGDGVVAGRPRDVEARGDHVDHRVEVGIVGRELGEEVRVAVLR